MNLFDSMNLHNSPAGSPRIVQLFPSGLLALVLAGALVLSALLAPTNGLGAPPRAQGPLSDVRVNQVTTADQHEPTLAVDPTNPNNILAAAKDWRTGPKQVWYYHSTDGGGT